MFNKKPNRKQIEKSMRLAANALQMANQELQGAVVLNWVLVKRAGGVVTIPQSELSTDVPTGSGLKVHYDAEKKEFTFTALDKVPGAEGGPAAEEPSKLALVENSETPSSPDAAL